MVMKSDRDAAGKSKRRPSVSSSSSSESLFLGIDVGTQGARIVVCDSKGYVAAQAENHFPLETVTKLPSGWFEQNPSDWWNATAQALRRVVQLLKDAGKTSQLIQGASVTSTSGTVCMVDANGHSLGPALMYNDGRASVEAQAVQAAGAALAEKLGYRFNASFALPKILWLQRHDPERYAKAARFLSPTDFIIGQLTGHFGVSDYTNVLKTGYDLIEQRWPDFVESKLGIPRDRLPRVVAPGTLIGEMTGKAAKETGISAKTKVMAGMTDGCASQVASGAGAPGQWNSTIGTTLVIKGVTRDILRDPLGRVYCHLHPDGYWLPGGASNTGGEGMARRFDPVRFDALGAQALKHCPTGLIIYPLARKGERFPFEKPDAEGFILGNAPGEIVLYAAHLEGVGYVERLAYDVLIDLGACVGDEIYAAGGAVHAEAWLQVRADILQKTLHVPANPGGAMGAAIIAAGGTIYKGIVPAAQAMVRIVKSVKPRISMKTPYEERYQRFLAALRERGYIS